MPNRIFTTFTLALAITIVAVFAASEANSSCTFTAPGKGSKPDVTFTIESVYSDTGQLYFPCDDTVFPCPDGNYDKPKYLVAAWTIESSDDKSKLSAAVITVPTGLLVSGGSNWETDPQGSHLCVAGDPGCYYPSTVNDSLEFSFQTVEDRMVLYFMLDDSAGVQGNIGQSVASFGGNMYFCDGEFSVPGLATGAGLQTTEEIKTVTQEWDDGTGTKDYTICIKTVKKAYEVCPPPGQVYYACLPETGDCNDVNDWCPFTPVLGDDGKPKKEDAEITQYAGEPRCQNALVAAPEAAYMLCYEPAEPTCVTGTGFPTESGTAGLGMNPCNTTRCIEIIFGGYAQCACW